MAVSTSGTPASGWTRQLPWSWVLGCLVAVLLLGLVDSATAPALTFAPLYVIPVALATWFAGLQRGVAVALAAAAAWLLGRHIDPAAHGVIADLSNALVRVGAYIGVALLLTTMRSTLLRQFPGLVGGSIHGVLDARQFSNAVDLELSNAGRYGCPLSCAYVEIDRFRVVWERHGPVMAVLVLNAMGRSIRCHLRRADVVGRVGAERFVVLLPETSAAEAAALVERLRSGFSEYAGFCPVPVGLSASVLSYENAPPTLEELMRDVQSLVASKNETDARL